MSQAAARRLAASFGRIQLASTANSQAPGNAASPSLASLGRRLRSNLHTGRSLSADTMAGGADVTAGGLPTGDCVDITRENFNAMLPAVEEALKECTFYAYDCEMTGLFLESNGHDYLDTMQARALCCVCRWVERDTAVLTCRFRTANTIA